MSVHDESRMSPENGHPGGGAVAETIDAYLDGVMTPTERADFERRALSDAHLRDEIALQARIDGRLRVLMSVPEIVTPPLTIPIRRKSALPMWTRLAAAVLLVGAGVWMYTSGVLKFGPPQSAVAASAVMARLERTGFEPAWVCESDAQFSAYTREKLGVEFLVNAPKGVQLVGWSYADGVLGDSAPVLLARHEGSPLIVVMDRAKNDHHVHVEPSSGLLVHRQMFNGLVLYEISREPTPVIVNHLAAK